MATYKTFTRNWWKMEKGERVPDPTARKTHTSRGLTIEEARNMCLEHNRVTPAGKLSNKMEFEAE
jgi:hypothetical protein